MKIVIIFGTRPEAIKLGPVVAALRDEGIDLAIVCTGQHTTLLHGTPAETDLRGATSLALPSTGEIWDWTLRAAGALTDVLVTLGATDVMVQGDTMSALAGARAAVLLGLPLHHVEAGLRSHDLASPYPEELIRTEIASHATWHYAPTQTARANLVV